MSIPSRIADVPVTAAGSRIRGAIAVRRCARRPALMAALNARHSFMERPKDAEVTHVRRGSDNCRCEQ